MDTLRGNFDSSDSGDSAHDFDNDEDETGRELPPESIGQDERRMQVRAYNHWASLLQDRSFPSIEDLDPENQSDFGPFSVLLDFSTGVENPSVQFLGSALAAECGAEGKISKLSDVPSRSLLSRITDHYMQILANQAPIGFEAEFVNQRGATILYRGILLPYSSDNETIDFIYGVINWKEMADQTTADELLLEIDQVLEADEPDEDEPHKHHADPVTDWADGPASEESAPRESAPEESVSAEDADDNIASFEEEAQPDADAAANDGLPSPKFGDFALNTGDEEAEEGEANYDFASLTDHADPAPRNAGELDHFASAEDLDLAKSSEADEDYLDIPLDTPPDEDAGLYDCLASAREAAQTARSCEDRSRSALYAAVGRAYDFSLAAKHAPDEYEELITENGLAVQDRAPMTPVVKLVFGADYDKTRLTEYAAVLSHAHRLGIARGELGKFLGEADGGLKGVVNAERQLRREEAGKPPRPEDEPRPALAKKLRAIDPQGFDAIASEGSEFALVMIRRTPEGEVVMLGEIEQDIALLERAARKLVG